MAGVRQFNEADALEKALVVFWQKGFAETSMQELAAATGIQRGSLYNAYQDKETLFLRAYNMHKDRYLKALRKSLDKPMLREALYSFFDFVIGSMTTGVPTRGCLTTKAAFGYEIIDVAIQAALREMLDGYETILTERFALAGPDDGLTMPGKEAAQLIVVFTRGIVIIERMYQDKARLLASAETLINLLLGAEKAVGKRYLSAAAASRTNTGPR